MVYISVRRSLGNAGAIFQLFVTSKTHFNLHSRINGCIKPRVSDSYELKNNCAYIFIAKRLSKYAVLITKPFSKSALCCLVSYELIMSHN